MLYLNNGSLTDLFNEMNDMFGEGVDRSLGLLKTDICEDEKGFTFMIDVPGYNKEDIKMDVTDGYLNISVTHNDESKEDSKNGKYIRRERIMKSQSRSYYVGDVNMDEIKAKFTDGVLTINVPHEEKHEEPKKFISIE